MSHLTLNQPLPPNPFTQSNEGLFYNAYKCCLDMEHDHSNPDDLYLVHARCLGYLITELPPNGRKAVADEINLCCKKDEDLKNLSEYYIDSLIRLFKANKRCSPALSSSDGEFFESDQASFAETVEPAPRDHTMAKKSALVRDSYRCVVTGCGDYTEVSEMTPKERQKYNLDAPSLTFVTTDFCYIFSSSTNWNFNHNDSVDKKRNWSSLVWAVLESFGSDDLIKYLDERMVHDLTNGFTICADLHLAFSSLLLWFEYLPNDPQPNTYRVCSAIPRLAALQHLPPGHTFTFTSTDPSLPIPRSQYLQLHAAVCRVACLSGVGRYLDLEEREIEMVPNLARDGSSAHLLASRLKYLPLAYFKSVFFNMCYISCTVISNKTHLG